MNISWSILLNNKCCWSGSKWGNGEEKWIYGYLNGINKGHHLHQQVTYLLRLPNLLQANQKGKEPSPSYSRNVCHLPLKHIISFLSLLNIKYSFECLLVSMSHFLTQWLCYGKREGFVDSWHQWVAMRMKAKLWHLFWSRKKRGMVRQRIFRTEIVTFVLTGFYHAHGDNLW